MEFWFHRRFPCIQRCRRTPGIAVYSVCVVLLEMCIFAMDMADRILQGERALVWALAVQREREREPENAGAVHANRSMEVDVMDDTNAIRDKYKQNRHSPTPHILAPNTCAGARAICEVLALLKCEMHIAHPQNSGYFGCAQI